MLEKTGDRDAISEFQSFLGHDRLHWIHFHRDRTPGSFLQSIVIRKPLAVFRNYCKEAQRRIDQLATGADVLFIDHYLMYQYVPSWFRGRVAVLTHNAEFLLWSRAASFVGLAKRLVLAFEADRVRRYERKMLESADAVLALPNDLEAFRGLSHLHKNLIERPPFGDQDALRLPAIDFLANDPVVLFIGTLSWEANLDGLRWFLRECWPRVRSRVPSAAFWVGGIGGSLALQQEFSAHPGVRYLGFVEELESAYTHSRAFIAPLRFGSGIKIKVLNALFRGLPVVCTSCGAEGLNCGPTDGVSVSNDAEHFADAVSKLLLDPHRCSIAAEASRKFAKKKFSGDQLFRGIDFAIEGVEEPR